MQRDCDKIRLLYLQWCCCQVRYTDAYLTLCSFPEKSIKAQGLIIALPYLENNSEDTNEK